MVIKLTEEQYKWLAEAKDLISEDVYMNGIKGKKVNLTYDKRANTSMTKNRGNLMTTDRLDTGKMDQNNADTYIVPLKGGINSYNITSIKGTEVMHYFKNKANNKKTNVRFKDSNQEFELDMEDPVYQNFLNMFLHKVGLVVADAVQNFGKNDFTEISIYPVPSSSGFNKFMCEQIAGKIKINGLSTRYITDTIFKKDLTNLQKDEDFINKNKEYYSDKMYKSDNYDNTHEEVIDDTIRKFNNTTAAQNKQLVDNYNKYVNAVILSYRNKVNPKTLAKNYMKLVDAEQQIRQKLNKSRWENAFNKIKYAKGPSVETRSENIWNIVTPILGKTYMSQHRIEIVNIDIRPFQIKNLTNDTRMGLKNYFKVQDNLENEIKQIQNTIFVIFDDNVSGGATLSDICYQCKKIGINYLVPITFGEMRAKYTNGVMQVNKPKEWNY